MAEQGLGEGTVAAGAVEGDIVGLRREGDEKAGGVADARQPLRMRGSRGVLQRIGAARIQKHQMNAGPLLLHLEDFIKIHGMLVDILFIAQFSVHRNEIIMRRHLQPMAAVVEKRNVGGSGGVREFGDRALHARLIEIDAGRDLEAQSLEFRGDVSWRR